jgi:acyl-coenzyme A thioesterase PaaI-like protein
MSAIDTTMVLAVLTLEDNSARGTASQSTRFLRPAGGEPMLVEATVVKAGRTAVYGEVHVRGEDSGTLVAHATCEFL